MKDVSQHESCKNTGNSIFDLSSVIMTNITFVIIMPWYHHQNSHLPCISLNLGRHDHLSYSTLQDPIILPFTQPYKTQSCMIILIAANLSYRFRSSCLLISQWLWALPCIQKWQSSFNLCCMVVPWLWAFCNFKCNSWTWHVMLYIQISLCSLS